MAYKDRGYGTTIDNYKEQQEKKKRQQEERKKTEAVNGPVSTQRLSLPKVNSTAPSRAASTSAPIQTQRFYNPNTTFDFSGTGGGRGTTRTTSRGYTSPPPAGDPNIINSQLERQGALMSAMQYQSNVVNDAYDRAKRAYGGEDAFNRQYDMVTRMESNLKYLRHQAETGAISADDYNKAYDNYLKQHAKAVDLLDAENSNYARKAEKAAAMADYNRAVDTYGKLQNEYLRFGSELGGRMMAEQQKYNDWRSKIGKASEIQSEIDSLKSERDSVYEKLQGYEKLQRQVNMDMSNGSAQAEATAMMIENAMNLADEIKRLRARYDDIDARIQLNEEELQYSKYFGWQDLANADTDAIRWAPRQRNSLIDKVIKGAATPEEKLQAMQEFNFSASTAEQMTDAERETYDKIASKYGYERALEYYNDLENMSLNTRRRASEEKAVRDMMDNSTAGYIGANVLSVLTKPAQIFSHAGQTAEKLLTGKLTKDAPYNAFTYLNNAVRNKTSEDIMEKAGPTWGKWGAMGYQTGMSMLDFLYNTTISGGWTSEVGQNIGLLLMGSEAAADETMQAKERGLNDNQAYWLGIVAGAAEIVTEKFSLETLLNKIPDGMGWKGYVEYLLKNVAAEGSEEGASDLINLAADILISKSQSEWATTIREYEKQGLSSDKAFQKALEDQAEKTGMSMLGGALSGGTMALGGMAINFAKNAKALTDKSSVDWMIQRGMAYDKDSRAYKAAEKLQAKLDAGKDIGIAEALIADRTISDAEITDRQNVRSMIRDGEKYKGTKAEELATDLRKKLAKGQTATAREARALQRAVNAEQMTDSANLKKSVDFAKQNAGDKAVAVAEEIEQKLNNGEKVSLRQAERLSNLIGADLAEAYQGNNPTVLGRMLNNENGMPYLQTVANEVLMDGSDEMQTKAATLQQQIQSGKVDATIAGQVAMEAERIRSEQQTGERNLSVREVTADMDAFDRSAAETGVSAEEAGRHKLIMKALGVDGEYRVLDNNRVNAYYDNSTGKMVLNARSNNLGPAVIAHEVTHSLEKTASYQKLADMIIRKKGGAADAILNAITEKYQGAGITLDAEGARSEMVAEYVEKQLLTNEDAINEAVRQDRSFGEWMRDKLDDLLAKLGNQNAQERKFLRQAREYYAKALGERDKARAVQEKIAKKRGLELPKAEQKAPAPKNEGPKGLELSKADENIRHSISQAALTAGIEMRRDSNNKLTFYVDGQQVNKISAEHIRDHSAFGALITTAWQGVSVKTKDGTITTKGHITEAQAKAQYKAIAELMNTVMQTQDPELTWAVAGSQLFAAVKSNSDGQYGTTVDFTTVCRKTQEMITAMSERMMAKKGGLTKKEVTNLQKELIDAKLSVPCPVCYVFSRWAGVGSLLDNMYTFQNKYANYTAQQIQDRIDELKARDTKAVRRGIRASLRDAQSEMYDEAYTSLAATKERLQDDNKALKKQLKIAQKNGIQADIDSIQKSITFNTDSIKGLDKQMNEILNAADTGGKELVWLQKVRQKDSYKPVPADILFNMASDKAVETFMTQYPDSWNYRTTRGPAMGKAILPYSDFRLGDLTMPLNRNSAAMYNKGKTNAFGNPMSIQGEFTDAQKKEIISAIARVRAQNLIGGQRFQSTSDFRYDYALDYIQAFFEAQALGSNIQTYTKIIEFGEMVAKFGGDVNLSVMPLNKGHEDGHLIYSNVTGIDFGAAKLLSEKYDSAQLILVGINDEHIRLALEDSAETGGIHIGFVIPYHASGASIDTFIRDLVSNLNEKFLKENYTDYSTVQTDTIMAGATQDQRYRRNLRWQLLTGNKRTVIDGKKKTIGFIPSRSDINSMKRFASEKIDISGRSFEELLDIENRALNGDPDAIHEYERWSADALYNLYKKMWTRNGTENGVRLNSSQAEAVMPHEYWDKTTTRDTAYLNGFLFRSYCFNLGLHPRFTGIDSKGNVVDFGDFRESTGYWKTLIDRAMYANDGTYRDQQAINLSELNVGMIDEDAGRETWGDAMVRKPDVEKAAEIGRRYSVNGQEESAIYIKDGTDMDGNAVSFTDLILDGKKLGETRNTKNLPVGEWVGITKGGKNPVVVGRVMLGEPIQITNQSPEYKDAYIQGTEYDIQDGEKKWYYPIERVEDFRDSPRKMTANAPVKGKYRYSVSKDQDAAYLKAVQNNDMETAQRLVDEAARKAGYRTLGYHGSPKNNIHIFDGWNGVSYFTNEERYARGYAWGSENGNKIRRSKRAKRQLDNRFTTNVAGMPESFDVYDSVAVPEDYDGEPGKFFADGNTDAIYYAEDVDKYGDLTYKQVAGWHTVYDGTTGTLRVEKGVGEAEEEYRSEKQRMIDAGNGVERPKMYRVYLKMDNPYISRHPLEGNRFSARFNDGDAEYSAESIKRLNELKAAGYDGVIVMSDAAMLNALAGEEDNAENVLDYVVFDPTQIKSADPVTYDDSGKPIPLSERFNPKNKDIRYSVSNPRTESELIDSVIDPQETAKTAIQDAVGDYLDSIGVGSDIPGMDKISTGTKKNAKLPVAYKARDAARFFYRKMVDSGEAVTRLGKYTKDPHLYHYYNMARASSNSAVSMIQDAQTDVMGRRVGESLNSIFKTIRAKGEQYYADLQAYLYHTHNIDRMSRENPGVVAGIQAELEQFRQDNPELAGMSEAQIERASKNPASFVYNQAQLYMQILRRLNRADTTHNKPVFGHEVSAEQSRRAAEDLREKLEQTEGFEEDVEKIRKYIDNLMQYRIDSGLVTADEYDRLKDIYPNYVPTFREQEPRARNKRGNTTEVGKTVGKAQGGESRLIPLHRALAQQTFSVVREGSKNRFGQMLLEGKTSNSHGMIKNVAEAGDGFHEDTFDEPDIAPQKANSFIVRQGGKRYEIEMDNALYEAVTALSPEPEETNFAIKMVHKSNDLFKALCTGYNPTFLVRNFMRDLQDVGLYSKDLSAFTKQYPLAVKEIASNGKYWQMYKALGGLYSSFFDYQTGEVKESGKLRKYTVDAMEAVNMAVEQAPRLAEFMATVKKAEKAGNLSMDTLMEAIYNAADVTVNFGRSGKWGKMFNRSVVPFFNPGVQGFDKMIRNVTETKGFKDWARLAAKATILGIAPAVISRLLFGKRKDWDEIKQRDKDIYYLFPLQDGVWLKLPKGRVLSVFGMAADRAMQGKDADWASFIETSLTQTAPENPLTASYWRPWLDAKLFDKDDPGKTWYGSDIENQRLRNLAPGQRYDTTTDALSKWLGKTFNLSPKKINYLLDQYSGVIGDVLLPLTSDRAEKGLFTNAFTIDSVVSNQLSEDFYDMKDRLTWAKNDPNATGEDEALYKYWNEQTSAISDINKAIRAIEQDKSLTDKEKRDLTRVQYSLRNGIMRNALDSMSDYRAGGTDNDIYSKVSDAQAQEERESKTYNFKGQDVAWDDLSGTQKKIVQAQDAIDNDPNADLSEIIGKGNATKKLAQYQAARDQGISNQTYIDALQAIDDADDGNGNYNQAEAKAGLDKLISDGTISEKEAGTLWKIITGGADKNNPFPVGAIRPMGLRLPKIG